MSGTVWEVTTWGRPPETGRGVRAWQVLTPLVRGTWPPPGPEVEVGCVSHSLQFSLRGAGAPGSILATRLWAQERSSGARRGQGQFLNLGVYIAADPHVQTPDSLSSLRAGTKEGRRVRVGVGRLGPRTRGDPMPRHRLQLDLSCSSGPVGGAWGEGSERRAVGVS